MTDAGEAIVFGADGDVKRTGAGAGAERGGEIANPFFYIETGVGKGFAEPGRAFLFLKTEFGMGVDAVAEGDQSVAGGLKTFTSGRFNVHGRAPFQSKR